MSVASSSSDDALLSCSDSPSIPSISSSLLLSINAVSLLSVVVLALLLKIKSVVLHNIINIIPYLLTETMSSPSNNRHHMGLGNDKCTKVYFFLFIWCSGLWDCPTLLPYLFHHFYFSIGDFPQAGKPIKWCRGMLVHKMILCCIFPNCGCIF